MKPYYQNPTYQELWFLQITLSQKAKEHVAILLEEEHSFDHILTSISSHFKCYKHIYEKYQIHQQKINQSPDICQNQILTRKDIETIRGKRLSIQAPIALEYRGNPAILSKKIIGIVGSRHPTYYGRLQAQKFSTELSQLGYAIISGGAIGIDAIANSYSLKDKCGASISIIGNGVLKPYPSSNRKLFHTLSHSSNGLLMSEFESNSVAQKWHFPQRNATIAELCDFLLVIEATPTSGSLMTARFAQDCGKNVGALPGSVDNPNTTGSHLMIQSGAYCIQYPQDILKYL